MNGLAFFIGTCASLMLGVFGLCVRFSGLNLPGVDVSLIGALLIIIAVVSFVSMLYLDDARK